LIVHTATYRLGNRSAHPEGRTNLSRHGGARSESESCWERASSVRTTRWEQTPSGGDGKWPRGAVREVADLYRRGSGPEETSPDRQHSRCKPTVRPRSRPKERAREKDHFPASTSVRGTAAGSPLEKTGRVGSARPSGWMEWNAGASSGSRRTPRGRL